MCCRGWGRRRSLRFWFSIFDFRFSIFEFGLFPFDRYGLPYKAPSSRCLKYLIVSAFSDNSPTSANSKQSLPPIIIIYAARRFMQLVRGSRMVRAACYLEIAERFLWMETTVDMSLFRPWVTLPASFQGPALPGPRRLPASTGQV